VKELGGVNAVKKASLEELKALRWLPDTVAEAVHDRIHRPGRPERPARPARPA
jgi:excinuclease ABC subunit C